TTHSDSVSSNSASPATPCGPGSACSNSIPATTSPASAASFRQGRPRLPFVETAGGPSPARHVPVERLYGQRVKPLPRACATSRTPRDRRTRAPVPGESPEKPAFLSLFSALPQPATRQPTL